MHSKIDVPKKVKATYNLERREYYLKKIEQQIRSCHIWTRYTRCALPGFIVASASLASVHLAGPSVSFFFGPTTPVLPFFSSPLSRTEHRLLVVEPIHRVQAPYSAQVLLFSANILLGIDVVPIEWKNSHPLSGKFYLTHRCWCQ